MLHQHPITRRHLLQGLGGAALLSFLGKANAFAQGAPPDYKALVCLFLAGGNDANNLIVPSDTTGYNAYAAGRGALALPRSGLLGVNVTANDGHTILLFTAANTMNITLIPNLPYDMVKDFAPITMLVRLPSIVIINPALPVKSVQELVAYARARPGELNYGSSGNASSNHLAGELFRMLAKVDIVHVPYKGLPQGVTDLLGGRVQLVFGSPASTLPATRDGKLKLLAVTTPKRSPALPDTPTIAESGVPGYEFTGWIGVLLPARTANEIIVKLSREVARIVQLPDVKQRLDADATESVGSTPEQYAAFLKAEIGRWTKVARAANIQVD